MDLLEFLGKLVYSVYKRGHLVLAVRILARLGLAFRTVPVVALVTFVRHNFATGWLELAAEGNLVE